MTRTAAPLPAFVHTQAFFWFGFFLATVGVGFAVARTYRDYSSVADSVPVSAEMNFNKTGLFDFHMGGYFPALAFRHGINPYAPDVLEIYPMLRPAPTYSPVVFMLHVPFSYFSVPVADVIYSVFNLALLGLLAYFSLTMSYSRVNFSAWLAILGLFVFSRAGHITIVSGYFTLQLVIGTLLALHYGKTKPWLAGWGILLAGKPTYIIPLIILMLARKNLKAVAIGVTLSAIGTAVGITWLASFSSFPDVVDGILRGEKMFHADENETPENTWTRLDLIGIVAKTIRWKPDDSVYLATMFGLLLIPCFAIWRSVKQESNPGATGLTAMIAALAILVTIYHHSYDCLLVAVPWIGVTFFGHRVCPELSRWELRMLSVLLAIPAVNYAATYKVRELFGLENQALVWDVLTSMNGVALAMSLVIVTLAAFRVPVSNSPVLSETN